MTYSDGDWSGRWVDNAWTPGYWYGGTWHQAMQNDGSDDWTVSVNGSDYTLSEYNWEAMPQAPMPSRNMRSTSAVDSERSAEYGAVKGYSNTREPGMYNEGDAKSSSDMDNDNDSDYDNDRDNDNDDHYEGAKCGGYSGGCGCNKCGSKCGGGCGCKSKCGGGCGSKCGSKCGGGCGSKCGSRCGGGCGNKCGSRCGGCSTCGNHSSCNCPGAAYDCWGVWHADSYWDFDATRDSDYDPVLGDGGRGSHGFFGW